MLTLFKTKFKVRILYKSGNSHEFWVTEFNLSKAQASWKSAHPVKRPLLLGLEEVEAVWQVDARVNVFTAFSQKCSELFGPRT